ncbi:immunity 53 family protein [Streptomyces sp. KL118A]|uniref:immunity 53 family protein n=1 Tax=Streptomyces sp. KL118A TaxID=3045153 RepID=UPI00278C63DD|nr:immunity 53 family protein [Streptomyces sp. KL118A]
MMSNLKMLQQWYSAACDGDWEHSYGIRIETTDNPGWILSVDLTRTALYGRTCEREDESADGSWVSMKSDGIEFVAACDPSSLERAIGDFIEFAAAGPG